MWIEEILGPSRVPSREFRELFGGKGASLKEMAGMGVPVPDGLILTTELCRSFYKKKKTLPSDFERIFTDYLNKLEKRLDKFLGDSEKPLLISVRSGARASMPGMMDTILNLGLNDKTVEALSHQTKDRRFAFDSYRRFIQMYSNVVFKLNTQSFESILSQYRNVRGVKEDSQLNSDDLEAIVKHFKEHVAKVKGFEFPQDVYVQMREAIIAVLRSWMNKRAVAYRALYDIPESWGTAVIVQAMVFGNFEKNSGTGVAFTRHPSTGENIFFGEYLLGAQGEDVVAGIRTPLPLCKGQGRDEQSLEVVMPDAFKSLNHYRAVLETHYKDMQDIEFTIENGRLWILQTRNGKRTAAASLKMHMDMVEEGLISKELALSRFDPLTIDQLLHPCLKNHEALEKIGEGLPAAPGAAVGRIVLSPERCIAQANNGDKLILVRAETSPEDIEGMAKAKGILTACGGMTSHAAVVARGMGKTCIVGASELYIDEKSQTISMGGVTLKEGDYLTLDGTLGHIFSGKGQLVANTSPKALDRFMCWSDERRRLEVRANADTPEDVKKALALGAKGVGLCRSEHMFFESERILAMRQMILAVSPSSRAHALAQMADMQREDFMAMLRALQGYPLTVRLLDPPLHEFLPRGDAEVDQVSHALGIKTHKVRARLSELYEANPMLGNRGCRLGITRPDIYDMQVNALLKAAAQGAKDFDVHIEIMIPLVSLAGEFRWLKKRLEGQAKRLREEGYVLPPFKIGTMIELPRAVMKADKIAMKADFISFGTNDLTQTTFGFSRDDVSSFLPVYRKKGLLERDPFMSLDKSGVGELVRLAVEKARGVKPSIKIGVCGEHAGDPASIHFFDALGLDYVSCSPFRVPVARLAGAVAADAKL